MINAAIVGCSGYTAIEAIKLLLRHPEAQISAVTSRQANGTTIDAMHPQLTDRLNLVVEDLSPEEIATRCDVAFCCLPHGASAPIVSKLLASNCRVIDLSADYRLSTPQLYKKWYGEEHTDPGRLGCTPYGLPELFADKIRGANLIANPGCYPTSAILPLAPLIQHGLVEASGIVVDTHMMRLSRRLDLTQESDPVKIERDLVKIIPQERWIAFSHQMIHHGRSLCPARNPKCHQCPISDDCYAAFSNP